jgi:hypothetical protein
VPLYVTFIHSQFLTVKCNKNVSTKEQNDIKAQLSR